MNRLANQDNIISLENKQLIKASVVDMQIAGR